jgi:Tfp pilus assembly protein PilZ
MQISKQRTAIRRHPHIKPMFAGLRHYDRKDANFDVFIVGDSGALLPLEACNVSESGVFVQSMFLYEMGQEHDLLLRSSDSGYTVRVRGKVVRVEGGRGCKTPGMAYEFVATDRKTFDGLSQFVAAL